jgi:hypothetical protein
MMKSGSIMSSQNLLKAAATVLHKRIIMWSQEEITSFEPHYTVNSMNEEEDEEPIILAHTNQGFFTAQQ